MFKDWLFKEIQSIDNRKLSIIVFSLYFSWLLAFPFEGQVLYALANHHNIDAHTLVFGTIGAHFCGLFFSGYFIKTMKQAKRLILISIILCIAGSTLFFFTPTLLWNISLFVMSFLAGACVAVWSFFLKNCTPSNERIRTVADGLIFSNILMIIINMAAMLISPYTGLILSLIMLVMALFFAAGLSEKAQTENQIGMQRTGKIVSPVKPLASLCLFIVVITINSGLMYQVINPAFQHHQWLVSWYWALPYIAALYIMKTLPGKINRSYILYVAIAMIGFSFISYMTLDHSAASYLVVNTLMLGACGIYDLFWWSILGEMLDFTDNPAKIFGIGLSANVLGVLLGGILGNAITTSSIQNFNSSVLALIVVFIILIFLPLLHKQLSKLLNNHVYLTELSEMPPIRQTEAVIKLKRVSELTERETEITELLLKGRTYKMIASELFLSENTVKTHIKNIYSKLNIQSKTELVKMLIEKEHSLSK